MKIEFFENFDNAKPEAVFIARYPGSTRALYGDDLGGFPLQRLATTTGSGSDGRFVFNDQTISSPGRLDVLLRLDDNGNTQNAVANANTGYIEIYGDLRIRATSATNIRLEHAPFTGTNWQRDVPVPNVKSIRELYLAIDYTNKTVTVIVDSDPILIQAAIESWVFTGADKTLWYRATVAGIQNAWLPNFLQSIVIVSDVPAGKLLDLNTLEFHKSSLAYQNPVDMDYSGSGYVEDVDKDNPLSFSPGVFCEEEGSIEYVPTIVPNSIGSKIYSAARSDTGYWLEVGAPGGAASTVPLNGLVMPALNYGDRDHIRVNVTQEMPWISNGLGMEWGGEVDLITYAEVSTLAGLTTGTVNTGDKWLKLRLDGTEMYIPMVPARHSVSWDQLNAANLVYGDKTIVINGTTYSIRLLKGADTDPYTGSSTGGDPLGSRNSEWTRLFAPISVVNFPSYTGPKLAAYTNAQLGFGGTTTGRASWCQEVVANTYRIYRGDTGASYLAWNVSTLNGSAVGWRPVLIPLRDTPPEMSAWFYYDKDGLFFAPDNMRSVYVSDTIDL